MDKNTRVSTGIPGLDSILDGLRIGDNVVWRVDSIADYKAFVTPYVREALREGRRVVFAQFHDYIPGSSIHEVYVEARAELAAIAQQAGAAAVAELGGSSTEPADAAVLFNPLPRPRQHRIGTEAVTLPPLASARLADLPRTRLAPVQASLDTLDNGRVRASFDDQGRIAALRIDGVDLALRAPLGELVAYADQPHLFEAWDIDRQTLALVLLTALAALLAMLASRAPCVRTRPARPR